MTNMKIIPNGATILTIEDSKHYKAPIPKAWRDAIGILKEKKIDPLKYQKKIRQEWERRFKKQIRLGQRKTKKTGRGLASR